MAGKQCCVIGLYALAFSTVKDVKYWTSDTVDSILEHGTALYERLGKDEFLVIEDLPDKLEIFNEQIDVDLKFNSHGILNREKFNIDTMKDMISTKSKNTENELATGLLLMLSEFTVSVIIRKEASKFEKQLKLAVLDSHGRDGNGRICGCGMAVLMFFDNASNFIDYISNTYLNTQDSEFFLPYQIQFVYCTSSMSEDKRKRIIGLHRFSSFLSLSKEK